MVKVRLKSCHTMFKIELIICISTYAMNYDLIGMIMIFYDQLGISLPLFKSSVLWRCYIAGSIYHSTNLSTRFTIFHFIPQKSQTNKPYPFTWQISLSVTLRNKQHHFTYHKLFSLTKPNTLNKTKPKKQPCWMENCVRHHHHHLRTMLTLPQLPSSTSSSSWSLKPHLRIFPKLVNGRGMSVRAMSGGRRHCEFGSLNAPLEPRSLVGKFLSGVLQNRRQLFHVVTKEELKMLSDDRDSAVARMVLSQDTDEALLHRFFFTNFKYPFLFFVIMFLLLFFWDTFFFFVWIMDWWTLCLFEKGEVCDFMLVSARACIYCNLCFWIWFE